MKPKNLNGKNRTFYQGKQFKSILNKDLSKTKKINVTGSC